FRVALEQELARDPTMASPVVGAPARRPRRSGVQMFALSLGVVVALGAAAIAIVKLRAKPPVVVAPPPPKHPPASLSPAVWPASHLVRGLVPAADQTFAADGLRVQSAAPRDAAALTELRDDYLATTRLLAEFLKTNPQPNARAVAPAADKPPPLNLVLVPQAMLNQADLWPGFPHDDKLDYPSRYVPGKRTLYVADARGFQQKELPYGIAMHVLASTALSDDDCLDLADKFAAWYPAHARR